MSCKPDLVEIREEFQAKSKCHRRATFARKLKVSCTPAKTGILISSSIHIIDDCPQEAIYS